MYQPLLKDPPVKKRKNTPQNELEQPIVLNLTPSEIFHVCGVGFQTGTSQEESRVSEYEELIVWRHDVKNKRTGHSCRIAVIEGMHEDEILTEYIVELEVDGRFVILLWQSEGDIEDIKESAHQTFIKVCALIGVKVGYHLVTDPSPY